MALTLKGRVEGLRPVTGTYEDGKKQGERWYFLSMEVKDTSTGEIYSCQLPSDDEQYTEFVTEGEGDLRELSQNLKRHVVKVSVLRVTAGERKSRQRVFKANGEKNIGFEEQAVPVVRCLITNIRDLGILKDDDE